jgi:hypothetical protein
MYEPIFPSFQISISKEIFFQERNTQNETIFPLFKARISLKSLVEFTATHHKFLITSAFFNPAFCAFHHTTGKTTIHHFSTKIHFVIACS